MRLWSLRWLLLLVALAAGVRAFIGAATVPRLALAVVCGGLWFWMSRRKILSLDRQSLGLPARGTRRPGLTNN